MPTEPRSSGRRWRRPRCARAALPPRSPWTSGAVVQPVRTRRLLLVREEARAPPGTRGVALRAVSGPGSLRPAVSPQAQGVGSTRPRVQSVGECRAARRWLLPRRCYPRRRLREPGTVARPVAPGRVRMPRRAHIGTCGRAEANHTPAYCGAEFPAGTARGLHVRARLVEELHSRAMPGASIGVVWDLAFFIG
jgi:hypothetical protein